jgi:RimJ/RimL family protein N-acetyltransferase
MIARTALADSGIVIRPLAPEDAASCHAAVRESLETVGRWMPWCHPGYSIRDSKEWIAACQTHWAERLAFEFGVFGPDSAEVWGGVGINQINRTYNFGNLGFWVRSSRVRKGVAIAAARLAARFAFRELSLTRVELVALVDNIASRRVAEKLGATLEGVARNRLVHNGVPFAAAMYSLVPGDIPG